MSLIRSLYLKRLAAIAAPKEREDLSQSAIVFAPHPDDETLGCGGTILRKKAAGAAVQIVFMTDGSRSHRKLMTTPELSALRRQEAIAASHTLGVSAQEVTFLDFEDGQLQENFEAICDHIQILLQAHNPSEIYVTHPQEPHTDHAVLYWASIAAVKTHSPQPTIYAYPVWYWRHWPWTQLADSSKRETLRIVQTSLRHRLGTSAFRDFQHSVYVADVLPQKRAALNRHRSQMERFENNPHWPILRDVAGGEFLDCFFQPYELFYRPVAE